MCSNAHDDKLYERMWTVRVMSIVNPPIKWPVHN